MDLYTVALRKTNGTLISSEVVPADQLRDALGALGLTGREIANVQYGRGRGDDCRGQYVTWEKATTVAARQAVPGTVVYITTGGLGRLAGLRENRVTVGQWVPSKACGRGWADLLDTDGKFWISAAADDLLDLAPRSVRSNTVADMHSDYVGA